MNNTNLNYSTPSSIKTFLLIVYAAIMLVPSSAFSTDYYIDSINGTNSNSGTIVEPWNDFDRIKGSPFVAGDKIHLRRGNRWSGEVIELNTPGITLQHYGEVTAPLPVLEAMSDIDREYVENYNLEIFTPDPTNNHLDNFSGRWGEQLGSGPNNTILASTDTETGTGVSIKLSHIDGSSPQLSNTSLISLAANSELVYSFKIKVVDGQANFRIYTGGTLLFYDSAGNWGTTNTPHLTINSTNGWIQVIVPVTTPSSLSLPIINFYSSSAGTEIYLDDFTLTTKWTPTATPNVYRRMMVTPNAARPTRAQVNGIDIVTSNSLAELQSLPANDPTHNGKWIWGGVDERIFYMYFDSTASLDAANIRVNKTNKPLVVISEPNIVIDGLRLEAGYDGVNVAADDNTVRNCEVDNMLGNAMFIGKGNLPFNRISVSNNAVSNSGVGIYLLNIHDSLVDANTVTNIAIPLSLETDNETIGLQTGTNNIISNNILDIGKQGVVIWGTPAYPGNENSIEGNIISNMELIGIIIGGSIDGASNNLIHHNIIHHCGLLPGSPEKAGAIRQNKNAVDGENNYYMHNVLYNNKNSFSGESNDYNYPNGTGGSGPTANFVFSNNISLNPTLRHLQLGRNTLTGTTVSNNVFYPEGLPSTLNNPEDFLYSWNGSFRTLSEFESTINEATNNVGADPLFIDPSALDFHLQGQSPAIEVGTTQVPADINNWQPLLGIPDIGVFEYGAADSDGDGLSNYDERCHDGDCVNYDPYDLVTNPTGTDLNISLADSDGDGVNDGDEITAGTDPLNAASTPAISAPAMGLAALFALWLGLACIGFRLNRIAHR